MKNKMMHDVEVACGHDQLTDLETPLVSDKVFNIHTSINRLLADPDSNFFLL